MSLSLQLAFQISQGLKQAAASQVHSRTGRHCPIKCVSVASK